jgi:hypothetical protein
MPEILITLLYLLAIVVAAVVLFWVLAKIALPEPAALIGRIIIGIIILLLVLGLLVPSLGLGLRLGS